MDLGPMEQFFKCGSCWIQVCREAGLGQGKAREDRMASTTVCSCHKKDMINRFLLAKNNLTSLSKSWIQSVFHFWEKKNPFAFPTFQHANSLQAPLYQYV